MMCNYKVDDAGNNVLREQTLTYRLRELIKPQQLKEVKGVPMFTHDNPKGRPEPPLSLLDCFANLMHTDNSFFFSARDLGGERTGTQLV